MTHPSNKLSQFWQELKRRKVLRVITVYAAVAFVILQLVEILAPSLRLPEWTMNFILVLLIVGFIITVIVSWIYDIHPEGGIVKTEPTHIVKEEDKSSTSNSWKIASYISFVVIVALILFNIIGKSKESVDISDSRKTIAVLPFENMSDKSEFAHIGDAITDEIIMQLYKINAFEVRSRTSIMQYKSSDMGSPAIGQELNANYLLEGSAQRHEDQVRIRVQLIHAASDDHIWGEVYEGEWQDILDIQINVAKQVASELKTILSPLEIESIESKSTENIEAYNLYLRGRYFYNLKGKENMDQSIELFKRALEIDPDFALAYSGMAASYNYYGQVGISPRKDIMEQAKTAAMEALIIDNTLGEAHAELAWTRVYQDFDWIRGEKGFIRAIELNPNYVSAHAKYAWLLTIVGRHDEAIEEINRAIELDPLSQGLRGALGRMYLYAREYDKALEVFREINEDPPGMDYVNFQIALVLSAKGLHAEAAEVCSRVDRHNGDIGYIYGMAGQKEKTQEILDYFIELSENEFVSPTHFTFLYLGLGEKEKAIEWLDKANEQHEGWLLLEKVDPMYDSLRPDPRFQNLLEQMNYPDN